MLLEKVSYSLENVIENRRLLGALNDEKRLNCQPLLHKIWGQVLTLNSNHRSRAAAPVQELNTVTAKGEQDSEDGTVAKCSSTVRIQQLVCWAIEEGTRIWRAA
jgi:hypothetical protein